MFSGASHGAPQAWALDLVGTPERLRAMFEPAHTALLVVDVQSDFAARDGAMARFGADLSGIEPAIDQMQRVLDGAREAGLLVVWLRVISREDTDSGASRRFNARRGYDDSALAVCREGTPGADYYRLAPRDGEPEIRKLLYSGFHATALDALLRQRGIKALLFVGLTTECCVDSTVRDAYHRDYDTFVVTDACAAYGRDLHWAALDILSKNCALLATTDTLLAALPRRRAMMAP
jgi:nicotinamidase-related amidase